MAFVELFLSFLKVGFSSFGGLSMIPVINEEMLAHGWMSLNEVADIVAIAEMTPGPVGLNCATFAGIRVAGLAGALCATLGVLAPSLTVCLLAAVFLERFRDNRRLQDALYGVRPACMGLILATALSLVQSNFIVAGAVYWQSVVIALATGAAMWKWKLGVPAAVGISAVLGLLLVR